MNTEKYLRRIGIENSGIRANVENLKFLQKQHLLSVPFENLDIYWKIPIVLDDELFYRKIVEENRGGFCYELNGSFCNLLEKLGFANKIISAKVSDGEGNFGAEYDHLAILTKIDDTELLVDVGFGSFSAEPLRFVSDVEQHDKEGIFAIRKFDKNYFEVIKKDGDKWKSEYIFTDKPRNLSEFEEMCNFHQTSPESHFTRGKICSLMTENGRKTLTDQRFIETKDQIKNEAIINSEAEFNEILEREFHIQPKLPGE